MNLSFVKCWPVFSFPPNACLKNFNGFDRHSLPFWWRMNLFKLLGKYICFAHAISNVLIVVALALVVKVAIQS